MSGPEEDCTIEIIDLHRRRPVGGVWVAGTVGEYRFQALVFSQHALNPDWEIGQSRISKLWVQHMQFQEPVYNWDRGLDIPAPTRAVQQMVDRLTKVIASHVFENCVRVNEI
jgi:hypothetical protein